MRIPEDSSLAHSGSSVAPGRTRLPLRWLALTSCRKILQKRLAVPLRTLSPKCWPGRLVELMTAELHYLELLELAESLRKREVSSVEATKAQLERIAHLDPHLASYALVTSDEALASAAVADAEIMARTYRGPLHGIPIGVKDLFYTRGIRTSGGMAIHRDFIPAEDATAVARLREAGAVILGKLQMTEGAYSDH